MKQVLKGIWAIAIVAAVLTTGIFLGNSAIATLSQCDNVPPSGNNPAAKGKPWLEVWAAICSLQADITALQDKDMQLMDKDDELMAKDQEFMDKDMLLMDKDMALMDKDMALMDEDSRLLGLIEDIELTPGPKGDKGDKGDTGSQGPAGITSTQVIKKSITLSPGASGSDSAVCPAGTKLTGGGFRASALDLNIATSQPFPETGQPTQWIVAAKHPGGGFAQTVVIFAVCTT